MNEPPKNSSGCKPLFIGNLQPEALCYIILRLVLYGSLGGKFLAFKIKHLFV